MSSKRLLSVLARRRLDRVRVTHAETIEEDREAILEGGLLEFTRRAWHEIESSTFRENWHHGLVAEHLEAVTCGAMKRLIINEPPGCSKTLMCSVLWNAWAWTVDPDLRWIYATYSTGLSRRDAVKTRNLIDSEWYRARWPHLAIPRQNTRSATDFANNLGGWRFSTTPGGPATGRHPDIQVVDDPMKPKDAKNKGGMIGAKLEEINTWWRETMPSRARDQATLRRVIVMQRLHDLDLAGEMIREGGWEHLRLPMRFESSDRARTFVFMDGARVPFAEDPRTQDGELLDPVRFPENVVAELETKGMGPGVAAAQLQQRPAQAGGNIFKTPWFHKRWRTLPAKAIFLQSWDFRFKEASDSGDWVVGGVWCVEDANIYAVDQVRGRWSFLESLREVAALTLRYPQAKLKLVENKANGPAVVNVMRQKIQGLVLVEPHGGKNDRAIGVTDLWEAGNVWLPEGNTPIILSTGEQLPASAPWVPGFILEHLAFPKAVNDDQVDQATQALDRLRSYDYTDYAAGVKELGNVLGI